MWRLVLRQVASLWEIETRWSMTDVLDANEALDIRDAIYELSKPPPKPPG